MRMPKKFMQIITCFLLIVMPTISMGQPNHFVRSEAKIDASIDLIVSNTSEAAKKVENAIKKSGGKIEKRSTQRDQYENQLAVFQASIPSTGLDAVIETMRGIGTVRSEDSDLDPSSGTVRIKISLSDRRNESYMDSPRQGRLFAGVAAARLSLSLSNDKDRSMSGGGITLSPRGQWAHLTIIVLKETNKETPPDNSTTPEPSSSGSSMVLIGHNFYSSIFGGGYRSLLNPYAGVTYGYSRLFSRSLFAIGGTIGLELLKMPWFTWSVSGNLMGLYSGRDGGTTNMYATHFYIPF